MSFGVDYASVDENRPPEFHAAFAWGVRFAIIRGTTVERGAPVIDPTLARDRAAARAAGLQVGAYLAIGWQTDPVAQAQLFVEAYGALQPGELPPAIDVEFPGTGIGELGLTPAQAMAKVEAALAVLQARYRTVMIYTSARVWHEDLRDIASPACGQCPCWLKVPYLWKVRNAPHVEHIPPASPLPAPWCAAGSPGAFIVQFQGDVLGMPGFSSLTDLSVFLPYAPATADPRTPWVRARLEAAGFPAGMTDAALASAIRALQAARGMTVDGVLGPQTWAALCVG